ncbi:MAG: helix-turn-helix transcriptional regulator [Bacteroidota bacterium]
MFKNQLTNTHIKKYWVIENPSAVLNKILPPMIGDGHLELLFIEGNGASLNIDRTEFVLSEGIYLTGQLKTEGELCLFPETKMHFIKLYQWANLFISRFPFFDLSNTVIPLSELNTSLNTRLSHFNPSNEIEYILNTLLAEFDEHAKVTNDYASIRYSCLLLATSDSDFSSRKKELLNKLSISDKTLESKFKQHVGLTPKQFSLTVKMRRIMEDLIYKRTDYSLSRLALEHGFFDQSHFIRSFRSLFKTSPRQLDVETYFVPDSQESFRYYTIH